MSKRLVRVAWVGVSILIGVGQVFAQAGDVTFAGVVLERELPALDTRHVEPADFDGDGRLDLLLSRNEVRLFRQVDAGRFTPLDSEYPGEYGIALVADLDGDGLQTVIRFHGTTIAAREFDAPFVLGLEALLTAAGDSGGANFAAVADLNNDGHIDLLADKSGSLRAWLGDGHGGVAPSFEAARVTSNEAELGDLDLDGTLDLLTSGGLESIPLLGQGDGTFVSLAPISIPAGETALGDLDADGVLDAAVAQSGNVQLLLGTGAGDFDPGASIPGSTRTIALADSDGDGDDDLARIGANQCEVHLIEGGQPADTRTFSTSPGLDVAFVDLDGNGSLTVVALTGTAQLQDLLLVDCDAAGLPQLESVLLDSPPSLAQVLADVDGDGREELIVWQKAAGQLVVHEFPGDGTLGPAGPGNPVPPIESIAVLHLDADLREDLLIEIDHATWVPWRSNGDGTFTSGPPLSSSFVALGDIDGDGDDDLFTGGLAPMWQPSLGDGSFAAALPVTAPLYEQNSGSLGDSDGDGLADLFAGSTVSGSTGLRHWKGLGGGAFAAPQLLAPPGTFTNSVFVDDLDGDGSLDAFAYGTGGLVVDFQSQLTVVLGNGDGTFQPSKVYLGGLNGDDQARAADFDGDGRREVFAYDQDYQRSLYLHQAADGTFGERRYMPFETDLVFDIDNDGDDDLLANRMAPSEKIVMSLVDSQPYSLDLGHATYGIVGKPVLTSSGRLLPGQVARLSLEAAPANSPQLLLLGLHTAYKAVAGGTLVPAVPAVLAGLVSDADGSLAMEGRWPPDAPTGLAIYVQMWGIDPIAGQFVGSNALQLTGN